MKKLKVMSVFGTRPEAVKMAPVMLALKADPRIASTVCLTAQHRGMLDQVMKAFGLDAEYDLDLMRESQTLSGLSSRILECLDGVIQQASPDIVLVHGDTTTSFVSGLVSFYHKVAVGHVEAGLRSGNKYSPFPEEMNRRLTGQLATLHFAPTAANKNNLLAGGITGGITVTGNTVIDALRMTVSDRYAFQNEALANMDFSAGRTIVVTAHRRENLGEPLMNICGAIMELVNKYPDIRVIYPVHLNPAVQNTAKSVLGGHPRIHLTAPLDVQDMHNLIARCHMVLTDSGGLQEEAPSLGKPVLVLRTETERPEAVHAGTVMMAGVEKANILRLAGQILDDSALYSRMANTVNPYGDGNASARIVQAILHWAGLGQAPAEFSPADK